MVFSNTQYAVTADRAAVEVPRSWIFAVGEESIEHRRLRVLQ